MRPVQKPGSDDTCAMDIAAKIAALVPQDPDLSRLPVVFHPGPTRLFGVMLIIGGLIGPVVVGGILGLLGLIADVPDSWGWIVLGFAAIPLLAIPWGWLVIRSVAVVRISADLVEYRRVTPFRRIAREAPLSDYTAIMYRPVLPPSSARAGVTMHAVELLHRGGDDLRIVLATDESLARETQAGLAALTGLWAMEGDPVRGG